MRNLRKVRLSQRPVGIHLRRKASTQVHAAFSKKSVQVNCFSRKYSLVQWPSGNVKCATNLGNFMAKRYEIPQNDEKIWGIEVRGAYNAHNRLWQGQAPCSKGSSLSDIFYWRRKWDRGGRAAWGKRKGQGSSMGFPTIATPSETNHPGVI
jgi:hypothetical protein